jgi:AmmeMemoRadiSam system protein A
VGTLTPRRALVEDVAQNAFAAAFRDSRFPPLSAEELAGLDLHLSRLTPLVPLPASTRSGLLAALRPGEDGLVLEDPPFRATFLPQVWEALPEAEAFVSQLFLKAGLPEDHWSETLCCFRYQVEEF